MLRDPAPSISKVLLCGKMYLVTCFNNKLYNYPLSKRTKKNHRFKVVLKVNTNDHKTKCCFIALCVYLNGNDLPTETCCFYVWQKCHRQTDSSHRHNQSIQQQSFWLHSILIPWSTDCCRGQCSLHTSSTPRDFLSYC